MKTANSNSRRKFVAAVATGAGTLGLSFIPDRLKAEGFPLNNIGTGSEKEAFHLEKTLRQTGNKLHPVAFDISQANPWGIIWSNVYYRSNAETGTHQDQLGIINVLRHHGMLFALNHETIRKYQLGAFFGFNDPITGLPAVRNPFYQPEEGTFPLPGLAGIQELQENGAVFFVCDMARRVYAQFVAEKSGAKQLDIYQDFVKGTLPGILPAPSGVWILGRLAENNIAYIDASVG
jgi:hypothetical protein